MASMYTERYLAVTGSGRLLTPGTYLHYVLHGRAKEYEARYLRALLRDLERRPDVVAVRSTGGSTAYVWEEDVQRS